MRELRGIDEAVLAARCAKGDREAFGELYRRYAGAMYPLCRRWCNGKSDADDLLQEGFLKIFDRIGSFEPRGEGSLRSWMSRVFVNEAVSRLRRQMAAESPLPVESAADVMDEDEPGLLTRIGAEKLTEFISELPAGYRSVLNLFVFEQKSHKEIAAMLGIAENSSTSQYHRAKKMLREKIEKYLNDNR